MEEKASSMFLGLLIVRTNIGKLGKLLLATSKSEEVKKLNCCLRILSVLGYTDTFGIWKYVVCSVLLCTTINDFVLQLTHVLQHIHSFSVY